MKLSEANYVFTTRIEIEDDFIELREPTTIEMKDFNFDESEKGKSIDVLKKLFPVSIVDHSYTNDDGNKAKNGDVAKMLEASGSLYLDILQIWFTSIPFGKRILKNSAK